MEPATANANEMRNRPATEDELEEIVNGYGVVRRTICPIARPEMSKALGTMYLMFMMIFLFSLIKSAKNAIVSSAIDPSAIPWIKLIIVMPVNIWMIALAQKIVTNNGVIKSFNTILLVYAGMWIMYGVVFCMLGFNWFIPEMWFTDLFADSVMKYKGLNFLYCLIGMVAKTKVVLYYTLSELFGSLLMSYMFWAFTNEYLSKKQALRLNPLFIICANIGLLCSSYMATFLNAMTKKGSYKFNSYYNSLFPMIIGSIVASLFVFKLRFEKIINLEGSGQQTTGQRRRKLSLFEALKLSFSAKLVISISIAVLTYNLSMNLIDSFTLRIIDARAKLEKLDVSDNMKHAEAFAQKWSAILVIIVLFVPSNRLIMGGFFFVYVFLPCFASIFVSFSVILLSGMNLGNTGSLKLIPIGGSNGLAVQETIAIWSQILMKIVKFASFDISKEAISMRINSEYRALFKGVYDGHFGKIGKSLGGLISIISDSYHNKLDIRLSSIPLFFIVSGLNAFWLIMMIYATKKFNESISRNSDIDCGWCVEQPKVK